MIEQFLSFALWLAGIGHFLLLGAGLQIPSRFDWKRDLAKLNPSNRKLMWTYGGFTALTIVAFGVLTLGLHDELLRGDRAALAVASFIGAFWIVRLIVDALYYRHSIWPPGLQFVFAHALLDSLFLFLAGTYVGLVVWHLKF